MSEYRRVHRLTPVLRAWAVGAAILTLLVFNFTTIVFDAVNGQNFTAARVLRIGGGVLGALGVMVLLSQVWWARIGFRLRDEDVELRSGVITTNVRSARYDRIQAVDVVEPLAPRLFGLASVRIEAAGGAGSAIEIGYLPRQEAEQVRQDVLSKIAQESTPLSGPHEEYLIPPVPVTRSLIGAGLRLSTIFTIVWSVVPVVTDFTIAVIFPVIAGFLPQIWQQIDQSWRYNAKLDGSVLNVSYGLADRRRQAVPLDRIHAISLSQPVLWRIFGWWSVTVNIAGYGRESNRVSGTSRLLPVGSYEQAVALITAINPLDRAHVTDPTWDLRSPKRARIASPIDVSRQAVALTPAASTTATAPATATAPTTATASRIATTSHGLFSRRFEFIEISHIQEITYRHGPLQRAMGLAHVRFNLVPGPVKMTARDLDTADAWALVAALRTRPLPPVHTPPGNPS